MVYGDFKDTPGRAASEKYYVIRHSIFIKIRNTTDMKEVLL